jgi:integrase
MAWLYQRGGIWWIGWRVNGRQFLKSTGESDRKKGEGKLREQQFLEQAKRDGKLTQEFIESLTGKPLFRLSLKKAAEDWLSECQGSTAAATALKYRDLADDFLEFLNATEHAPRLQDVTTAEILTFLTEKRKTKRAATVNQHRKILSSFFIRALKLGFLKSNPVLPIKSFKESREERQHRRAFSILELKLIYDKAPSLFWRYMVLGGFYSGLRLGDLVTLSWGAVDFNANVLRVTATKTGRLLQIPMAGPFRAILEDIRSRSGGVKPPDPLWPEEAAEYRQRGSKAFSPRFYDEVLAPCGLVPARTHKKKKSGREAKREYVGVSFHCLRHSFVSFLKATGGNQAVAKELAGHSSDLVSDNYTHMPADVLSNAVNQLPNLTDSK